MANGGWVFVQPCATKTPESPAAPVFPRPSFTSLCAHAARHELKQHFVPSLMSLSPHWAKNNNLIIWVIGEKLWPDFTTPQKRRKWKKMSPRAHTMFHTDICMHNLDPRLFFFPPIQTFALLEQLDKIKIPSARAYVTQSMCVCVSSKPSTSRKNTFSSLIQPTNIWWTKWRRKSLPG